MASSAGEFSDTDVLDEKLVVTAVALEKTRLSSAVLPIGNQLESYAVGKELALRLKADRLSHVFVLSDGQRVNGTELSRGFNEVLPADVRMTGGLAADGQRFEKTLVGLSEYPAEGRVAAIGFYGKNFVTGFGTCGGWTPNDVEHTITSSDGSILFKLDDMPALDVYREFIGRDTECTPATCLGYPLWVKIPGRETPVVRSVLGIETGTKSLVFAGDVPTGSQARLMYTRPGDLIRGAETAASSANIQSGAELAICISCVGRRLVLGSTVGDELTTIRRTLGTSSMIAGFYSYGELAPNGQERACQLHNQTMTITTFAET